MKKLCKILLLCVISITLFCAFSKVEIEQNIVHATEYLKATDFKVIEIDSDTPTSVYRMSNMLGIDKLTSKGDIYWDSEELTLSLRDVSIFQIEDPLLFDKEGNRKSLININIDEDIVRVIIIKENEITCFGTAFTFLGDAQYQIVSNGSSAEDVLHIHNRNCYDNTVQPAIHFAGEALHAKIGSSMGLLTLSLTGVGGVKGEGQYLDILGKTNLFLNATPEQDYYVATDPDNYIGFVDEEAGKEAVIYGFNGFNTSEVDSKYKLVEDNYNYNYQEQVLEVSSENSTTTASKYYLGKFRKVSTFDDFKYLLNLKAEDQGEGYVNILLTEDLYYEVYESDLDRSPVIVDVRGYKRIFLNGHSVNIDYNDNSDSDQNALFFNISGTAMNYPCFLEIYGSIKEEAATSSIEAFFDGSSQIFSLFYIGSFGTLNIMDDVILGMHEDISGINNEYDGNVIMCQHSSICNMYRGQIYGSDTFRDEKSMVLAFLVSLITLGIGTAFPWNSLGYRGVVCIEQDPKVVKFRMISGIVRSFEGRVIYTKNATADAYPWRYYGGQLKSNDAAGLFGYGYYNNKLIEGDVLYGQFANMRQIVYIENGNNYLSSTANMDEEAYQNGNYMFQGRDMKEYQGIYQISQMLEMTSADSIRYINPFYAPYIDKDLPNDIYVSPDSAKMTGYDVTLFNLQDGVADATMSKGYSSNLFVELPSGEVIQWNSALGSVDAGLSPFNALGYTWKDQKLVLIVRSSFPKEFDGTKVFLVITNNYLNTSVTTNVATIHATEGIKEPVIELKAPVDCFNTEPNNGYIMEMGKNNHGVNVKATIRSAYTDHLYIQWMDVTDHEPVSAKQLLYLGDTDEDGLNVASVSFAPPVGSNKEGSHDYELWVWTYSKYGDQAVILTTSRKVRFTVEASIPEVASVTPSSELHLLVDDEGTLTVTLGERVPENLVGFKWYYYPTLDHMRGIDGVNSTNISIGTMIPDLSSTKAILKTSGLHNQLVYNLESFLTLGKTYRIVFNEAGDMPGRTVKTTVNIADNNKDYDIVDFSYLEISGLYEYIQEFKYEIFDAQTLYINPNKCTFTIDFQQTALNASHLFEDFYLQELSEDGTWKTIKDLNPYLFGKNYLEVFEIEGENSSSLTLTGDMDMDGYYIYCKAYNKADSTKFTYTTPVRVSVGNRPVQPHFVDTSDYIYKIEDLYNEVLTSRYVETPYLNNERVVEYQYQFQKMVKGINGEADSYESVTIEDLEDYGILATIRDLPNGETELGVRMNSFIQAKGLYNYSFRVLITAYSPTDSSLTDEAYTYFYWEYSEDDDTAVVSDIQFYNQYVNKYYSYGDPVDGISRFKSKNGSLDIKDILYLTDATALNLRVGLNTRNDNFNVNYFLNQDSYKLFVYRIIEGVQREMPLIEFLNDTEAGNYIIYSEEDGWLWFLKPHNDGEQEEIPFEYQNIVVFGKYYHNGEVYRTENWQISYLDLSLLGNPSFDEANYSVELNTVTGDVEVTLGISTLPYNGVVYPNVDLNQAPLLAVDTGIYTAAADITSSGALNVLGINYVENYFAFDEEAGQYIYDDTKVSTDEALCFDEAKAPNKFITKVVIPYEVVHKLYEYYYLDGEALFTPDYLITRYRIMIDNNESFEYFQASFSEEELALLQLCWWPGYMYVDGKMSVSIDGKYPCYDYQIDYTWIKYKDVVATLCATGLEDDFGYVNGEPEVNSIKVVQNSETWIGEMAPVMGEVKHHWYLNDELIEGALDDCYYQADTGNLTNEPLIYKLVYEVSNLSGERAVPCFYEKYYIVSVIPEIKNPTIDHMDNYHAEYLDPSFTLTLAASIPGKTNEQMYYHWVVDGNNYITEEPFLKYVPERLGVIDFSCEAVSYLEYEVDGVTLIEACSTPAKAERQITVGKREVGKIKLLVDEPTVGSHPSNTVTPVAKVEGDTYLGYKVVSAYWNLASNATFQADTNYTLTFILESLENAFFAENLDININDEYYPTPTTISANQRLVTYTFGSSEATLLDHINLTLPEYWPDSLLRPLEEVETEEYKLVNSSWNSGDEYMLMNKNYVLTLHLKLANKYCFNEDSVVYINDSETNYQINGKDITISLDYRFSYFAKVLIGEKEDYLFTDANSEIQLQLSSADIPNGYRFMGWYNGEELITDATNAKYKISNNEQVIEAKFVRSSYTVSFNANGATGDMNSVSAPIGLFTLPKAKFTAPSGKVFSGWEVDGEVLEAGDQIEITKDVTLKAIWIDAKEDGSNPTPSTNPNEGNNSSSESTPAVQNKSNTGLIVVIIILSTIIVVGAGFGVYYFFLRKNKPTAPSSDTKPKE